MSYFEDKHGPLLNEERSLQLNPALAIAIGLNNAIVLQQLRFCLAQPKSGKVIDGEKYVWNTYGEWIEQHFPWWSDKTLQRIFVDLEKMGLVKSIQPEGVVSRKKYYTMLEGAAKRLTYERMAELKCMSDRTGQVGVFVRTTCPHPEQDKLGSSSTETTAKTSTEINHTGASAPCDDVPDVPFLPGEEETRIESIPFETPVRLKVFTPPTPSEVETYSKEIGYPLPGEAWCDSYAQKGWMVGKNKMKDWRCAVRTWKHNGFSFNRHGSGFNSHQQYTPADQRENSPTPEEVQTWKKRNNVS